MAIPRATVDRTVSILMSEAALSDPSATVISKATQSGRQFRADCSPASFLTEGGRKKNLAIFLIFIPVIYIRFCGRWALNPPC